MPVDPQLLETVRQLVAEVLGAEPDEVTPDSLFDADLGGESIDLLDLGFRCERELKVRVRFQDLASQDLTVNPDGTLTCEALDRLRERFPLVDVSRWEGRHFARPLELLTVADIAAIVEGAKQAARSTGAETSVPPLVARFTNNTGVPCSSSPRSRGD